MVVLARQEVEADMVASLGRDDDLLRRDPEMDLVWPEKDLEKVRKTYHLHLISMLSNSKYKQKYIQFNGQFSNIKISQLAKLSN